MAAYPQIEAIEFTRREEGVVGADCLWWWLDRNGGVLRHARSGQEAASPWRRLVHGNQRARVPGPRTGSSARLAPGDGQGWWGRGCEPLRASGSQRAPRALASSFWLIGNPDMTDGRAALAQEAHRLRQLQLGRWTQGRSGSQPWNHRARPRRSRAGSPRCLDRRYSCRLPAPAGQPDASVSAYLPSAAGRGACGLTGPRLGTKPDG